MLNQTGSTIKSHNIMRYSKYISFFKYKCLATHQIWYCFELVTLATILLGNNHCSSHTNSSAQEGAHFQPKQQSSLTMGTMTAIDDSSRLQAFYIQYFFYANSTHFQPLIPFCRENFNTFFNQTNFEFILLKSLIFVKMANSKTPYSHLDKFQNNILTKFSIFVSIISFT